MIQLKGTRYNYDYSDDFDEEHGNDYDATMHFLTVRQAIDDRCVKGVSCSQCVHQDLWRKGIRVDDDSIRT